jgi:hypothetical protein
MTDHSSPGHDKRLDLHDLDAAADDARTNAVVAAVLSRISAGASRRDYHIAALVRAQRALLAVAAALVAAATATIVSAPRRPPEPFTADVIASWAESRHVPTNGELLAAYRGYTP